MEFGWINVFGAAVVALLLIPNIVYALKNRGEQNRCSNRAMVLLEQIGRYACIVLMWLPLLQWKFGFANEAAMAAYLLGNALLLAAYWTVYALYFKRRTRARAMTLAVLPACTFLLSGVTLRHWLLVCAAALFAAAHVYVTCRSSTAK